MDLNVNEAIQNQNESVWSLAVISHNIILKNKSKTQTKAKRIISNLNLLALFEYYTLSASLQATTK